MFGIAVSPPLLPSPAALLAAGTSTSVSGGAIDLARADTPGYLSVSGASIVSTGGAGVTVRFSGRTTWLYQAFARPQDWSGTNLATITLRNEESFPVTLGAILSSSTNPADLSTAFNAPVTLGANETRRFALVLKAPDIAAAGLRALPAPAGAPSSIVYSGSAVDTSRIGHWRLSYQGTAPARVTLLEFNKVAYEAGFANLVDAFGQFTGRDWNGKIADAGDFVGRKLDEAADLAQNPASPSLYGNPSVPSRGVGGWKIATVNGRKNLIAPSGKPFWMTGLIGVHDWMATMSSGREEMFALLPSAAGEDGDLFQYHVPSRGTAGTMFYLQRSNLRQKYGRSYKAPFVAQLKKRLPSWGFNTVGAHSMGEMYDDSTPFTTLVDTNAFPTRLTTPKVAWTTLPDPYAATFQSWSAAAFARVLASKAAMKNLVGTFVDNEMSWGSASADVPDGDLAVAFGALAAPASQPARAALLTRLQAKYARVARLNAAWGTRFASFAAAANVSGRPNAAMRADLAGFVGAYAATYFSKVRAALGASGFKGLYLGCRFDQTNNPVVSAAAASVDVLSFNYYRRAGDMPWAYLNALPKPVLISEFGMAHNEAGGFAGQPLADTAAIRAAWVDEWLRSAATQPNIVGVQYTEYGAHPATGVADTQENYSYGIVDIADNPDLDLVGVFRRFARDLYTIRR